MASGSESGAIRLNGFSAGGGAMTARNSSLPAARTNRSLRRLPKPDKKTRIVSPKISPLKKFVLASRKQEKERELSRIDCPILTVKGVANLLHCNSNTVRKISKRLLPYTKGPGRRNLYLCENVIRYIQSESQRNQEAKKNSRRTRRTIDSTANSVRGRSSRRRTS